ncbi:MAG: patatin-like phospholipase family protein [Bacteriovoracia bacterium]
MLFRPKIGLALGGGGARGAAHIGVLQQLKIAKIHPHCIAGTSAGAIVASLYAFDVDLAVIEQEMKQLKPVDFTSFRFKGLGLFENSEIKELLTKLLPADARIEQARIPLAVKATNLLTGRGVVLDHGPVIPAVLASCCVPGIYMAQEIDGMILVDGGLTENVPLSALKKLGAHLTIGVNLNGNSGYTRPQGVVDVLSSAMDIAIDAQTRRQLNDAHVVISMDLTQYSRTSSEHFDQLVEIGKKATQEKIWNETALRTWVQAKKTWYLVRALLPLKIPDFLKKFLRLEAP